MPIQMKRQMRKWRGKREREREKEGERGRERDGEGRENDSGPVNSEVSEATVEKRRRRPCKGQTVSETCSYLKRPNKTLKQK